MEQPVPGKASAVPSVAFRQRCREAGVRPSRESVGDCFDNALCKSFFATLECELLDRQKFCSQIEARLAIFDYIEAGATAKSGQVQTKP